MTTTAHDDQFAPDPAHPAGAPVLYQHDDGRYGLSFGPAQFAVGEPAWHHVPIDVVERMGGGQSAATAPVQVKTRQTPVGLEIAVWQDGQCVYCDVEPAGAAGTADEREAFEARYEGYGFPSLRHRDSAYRHFCDGWRAALAAQAKTQVDDKAHPRFQAGYAAGMKDHLLNAKTDDQLGGLLAAIQNYGSWKYAEAKGRAEPDLSDVRAAWDEAYEKAQALAAPAVEAAPQAVEDARPVMTLERINGMNIYGTTPEANLLPLDGKWSLFTTPQPAAQASPAVPVFVLPPTVARIIRNVFLPSNPNKLRKAHPDAVAAAKHYIVALEAFEARAALTTQGASHGE